jgi:phage terminase large subunit GpA-like protein
MPRLFALPERLSVADWAEQNIVLSSSFSSTPGPIELSRTPYMREILETFTDRRTRELWLKFASQTAKTTVLELIAFYTIVNDPMPILWIFPEKKNLIKYVNERFKPMVESSPVLRGLLPRGSSSITNTSAPFVTAPIYWALAQSESDLAGTPAGIIIADEIDKYPPETSREGSPLMQAKKRLRTFPRSKFLGSSTPTTTWGPITEEYQGTDQRWFYWSCPGCREEVPVSFWDVTWDERPAGMTRREFAAALRVGEFATWWRCPECGHEVHRNAEKTSMIERGRWIGKKPFYDVAGWSCHSLISTWTTFAKLASAWQLAVADKEEGKRARMKDFYIHELATAYVEKNQSFAEQSIVSRVDGSWKRGTVPNRGVDLITMGIDVQHDGVYWMKCGWEFSAGKCFVMDWCFIPSPLEEILTLVREDTLGGRWFFFRGGKRYQATVGRALIDVGDGQNDESVYQFVGMCPGDIVMPARGTGQRIPGPVPFAKIGKSAKTGRVAKSILARERRIDVNRLKSGIARMMEREADHEGAVVFPAEALEDAAFQRQLCAEQWDRALGRWVKKQGYAANHWWDCWMMCLGGAMMKGFWRNAPAKQRREVVVRHGPGPG